MEIQQGTTNGNGGYCIMETSYKILKYLRLSIDDEGDGESNSITYQRKLVDGYIESNFATILNADGILTPSEYKKTQNCTRKWNMMASEHIGQM